MKLCDFGNSKYYGLEEPETSPEDALPYENLGTEGYLPPELVLRESFGPAIDIWATGVVIYRCISGQVF